MGVHVGRPVVHDATDVDGLLEWHATRPRDRGHQRGDLERTVLGLDVDHLEAGGPLLELLEHVGTTRPPEASARTMWATSGGVRIVASTSSPLARSWSLSAR